jgi:sterol desaturase/sphingolipid hydroxylase (fatty acid hydroxylase superfamily)/CDGSH-type Zn-finger protein
MMDFLTKDTYKMAVVGILILFALGDVLMGAFHNSKKKKGDWIQEAFGFFQLTAFVQPLVLFVAMSLMAVFFPYSKDMYWGTSMWIALPLYLLVDDVLQYWYHRKAHEWEWLWKLHRPHHASPEMGTFVTYRNASLYFVFLPNLWWGGIMSYLGFAPAVFLGLVLKQIVVIGAHSEVRWDRFLYKHKWLHPVAWLVERTISTPATHFAHHGKSARDGISDPNGNFSNTFFFWDLMFGTALITRKYPEEFGIENDPEDPWYAHVFYPFIKSKKEGSEISKSYKKESYIIYKPAKMDLEQGKYLWCACGMSKDNPFCNGSHHGTSVKPVYFEVKKKRKMSLCTCKLTKTPPYCDGAHKFVDLLDITNKKEKVTTVT